MTTIAFQDRMPGNRCFGCGPDNAGGLRIKSFWDGDESVCSFHPRPEHCAGPDHVLNGGITATLIDCHCVCTATAEAYRMEGREMGSEPRIWCVTGSLEIDYLAPVPIDRPVELRARVVAVNGKKTRLECSLSSDGRDCARGRVLAVRVPPSWREPEPNRDRPGRAGKPQ